VVGIEEDLVVVEGVGSCWKQIEIEGAHRQTERAYTAVFQTSSWCTISTELAFSQGGDSLT